MKIIDTALILVILITAVLAGAYMDRNAPDHLLPVPLTGGSQASRTGEMISNAEPARTQPASTPASPVVLVTVGLVVFVFGAIACFPLFADVSQKR